MNRAAAEVMVSGASEAEGGFYSEFMKTCQQQCGQYEDITVSLIGQRRGMKPQQMQGLHGWSLKPEELKQELRKCHPEPLTFHYLRSEKAFKHVHKYINSNVKT